jgi:minor histocompatibility antigen H13
MIGFVIGIAAIVFYNAVEKTWWITNLMAFGFAYGAMVVISPTTFRTGSLVLFALFGYDIFMVFFTPMMKTVAMALDVPVKMVFPGPRQGSMLGLGDVVLPGIMVAMSLRFDLHLHYLRKQVKVADSSKLSDGKPTETIKKERYVETHGLWGDRFWIRNSTVENGARFPKLYFKASLIGYVIGMITTLWVCQVFNAAQPALLYLVPGVLIAIWGTAYFRNELSLMLEYTEDGKWEWDDQSSAKPKRKKSKELTAQKASEDETHARHIFLLSLSEPKHAASKKKLT